MASKRSWRLVAGAFLHFVAPAYLVAAPLACLALAPAHATAYDWVRLAIPVSGWFLAGYTALALLAVLATIAIEPLLHASQTRREARDPRLAARASERRVARAIADGRRQLSDGPVRILDQLDSPRWDHSDSRFQSLSTDLAQIVRTAIAARDTATLDKRPELDALATQSLQRIEAALTALHTERAQLDEGDARTVARYIESRYAPADFASEAP
jgi:hypothetical protein